MRVHHLNCGTMHPPGTSLVCHVLLLETDRGLALVDSGFGLGDCEEPGRRFGPARFYVRPEFNPEETAVRQVAELGFDPRDVRDIVLTHFDADHVGGLSDFPWASVHLTAAESKAVEHPKTRIEKDRYRAAQREHGPKLVEHSPDGEAWREFASAKELTEIGPDVVLVNLPGHTRGHAAVAVHDGSRWVLHVGDSFYHYGQLDGRSKVPWSLSAMERVVAVDWKRVQNNHQRLAELWQAGDPEVLLVNAHDPALLARARETAAGN